MPHWNVFYSSVTFIKMSQKYVFTGQKSAQFLSHKRHRKKPKDKLEEPFRVDSITSTGLRPALEINTIVSIFQTGHKS